MTNVHDEAVAIFRKKKNLRVVELPLPDRRRTFDYKRVRGGFRREAPVPPVEMRMGVGDIEAGHEQNGEAEGVEPVP